MKNKNNQSVLNISLDLNIVQSTYGNARERQLDYAQAFEFYTVIILSSRKEHLSLNIPRTTKTKNFLAVGTMTVWKPWAIVKAIFITFKLLRQNKFAVVTAQDPWATGWTALAISKIFSIPLNIQLHSTFGILDTETKSLSSHLKRQLIKLLLSQANSVRVVNLQVIDWLEKDLPQLKQFIKYIPMSVDTNYYFNKVSNRKIQKIVSVGRLEDEKQHHLLLPAFARLCDAYPYLRLTLVGNGSLESELKDLSRKLGIENNIEFVGGVDMSRLRQILHDSDLFILLSKYEGFGLALIEAMAAGLVVVSTNVGVVRDLCHDQKELYVLKNSDKKTVFKVVDRILANPNKSKSVAKNGQEFALKQFDSSLLKKSWVQLLKQT